VHSVLFTGTMYSSFMHRPHHRRSNAAHDHPLSTTSALGRAGGQGGPTNPRLATVVRCGLRALDRRPVLGSTHLDRVAYVTVAGGRAGADPLGTC
jgi:hypothetical protein